MLGKAVQYTLNRWPDLVQVLQDGRLVITNAAAELVAKHFAVCRKNSLFAGGLRGANALMDSMSVLLTAKANGLKPLEYLAWLFRETPIQMRTLEASVTEAVSTALQPLKSSIWQAVPPQTADPQASVAPSPEQTAAELVRAALDACRINLACQFLPEFAPNDCRRSTFRIQL